MRIFFRSWTTHDNTEDFELIAFLVHVIQGIDLHVTGVQKYIETDEQKSRRLPLLVADSNAGMNIHLSCSCHEYNEHTVTIAPLHTIDGCIVVPHYSHFIKGWRLNNNNQP